uniref:Uncharacterized protein n=1 Tax=Parascaris equorum TaxID=6256 RepID=A0A914R7N6_PAREQ
MFEAFFRSSNLLFTAGYFQEHHHFDLSFEQILKSVHRSNYPNSYKSGVFGLNLDRLREANSDDGRRMFGLRDDKKSFFSRFFRRKS